MNSIFQIIMYLAHLLEGGSKEGGFSNPPRPATKIKNTR